MKHKIRQMKEFKNNNKINRAEKRISSAQIRYEKLKSKVNISQIKCENSKIRLERYNKKLDSVRTELNR